MAEHQMGIRDCRLGAAAAVTDGPGIGAGALRTDVSAPVSDTRAIDPPPAPIVTMSTIGSPTASRRSGRWW